VTTKMLDSAIAAAAMHFNSITIAWRFDRPGRHRSSTSHCGSRPHRAAVLEASITLELKPYCGHVLAVATRV
jgi:hypothetical protein